MNKSYFDYEPTLVEQEGNVARINFDVEKGKEQRPVMGSDETEEVDVIKACVVRVAMPLTRSRIIDAIVTAEYPNDVMQAVVNNYLANPEDAERKAEFDAMQAWRTKAKSIADEVLAASSAE